MWGVRELLRNCKTDKTNFWAVLSFVVGVPKLFKSHVGVPKHFARCFQGSKIFFNSSKIFSTLVPEIKNDYSLSVRKNLVILTGKHVHWNLFLIKSLNIIKEIYDYGFFYTKLMSHRIRNKKLGYYFIFSAKSSSSINVRNILKKYSEYYSFLQLRFLLFYFCT